MGICVGDCEIIVVLHDTFDQDIKVHHMFACIVSHNMNIISGPRYCVVSTLLTLSGK